MFAAIASIAVRIAPVAVRVVTHPKVISLSVQTAGIVLVSAGIRGAKLQGEDEAARRHAENIQGERDPQGFPDDPHRVIGLRSRVKRNLRVAGMGFAEEGRVTRRIVQPPVHITRYAKVRIAERRYDRLVQRLDLPEDANEVTTEQMRVAKKIAKAYDTLLKRRHRLDSVREWRFTHRATPGEIYLAEQIRLLQTEASSHEVRTDTVEAVYRRLLDEAIDLTTVDMTNAREAGMALFVAVSTAFKGDEIGIIRSRVLKSWVYTKHSLTQAQWHKFTQGWVDASSVAQTV